MPGSVEEAVGRVVGELVPPAQALNGQEKALVPQDRGAGKTVNKGKHKKSSGAPVLPSDKHLLVDEGAALNLVEDCPSHLGGTGLSSADRVKGAVDARKLAAGSGGGGSRKSGQIGSVVQGLTAVATESASRTWAEEGDAGGGLARVLCGHLATPLCLK